MKKTLIFLCCTLGFVFTMAAQGQKRDSLDGAVEKDEGPLVLKFEPKLDITANRKRTLFKQYRHRIDTMQISEKKKQRLLRNLYKDIYEGTFEKTQLSNTFFEDDMEY
ncbi:hypothetical protein ACFQZJ_09070 [Maribacter chungangensis]|uniref:GLPGLI family protein n=1 Tax=Maribacter chungangensis TaxID=1069117 RepID=A0ABW3B3B2_9FLAO